MIYTSYFASRKYNESIAVSISRGTPSWFTGKEYKLLAPSRDLLNGYKLGEINDDIYTKEFNKYLSTLDAEKVYNDLDGKVLLCYEKTGKFCHRHLVAEWLINNGYDVIEL